MVFYVLNITMYRTTGQNTVFTTQWKKNRDIRVRLSQMTTFVFNVYIILL